MENQIKQSRKQNWFQKQFSSRNSQDNRPKEGAYEAAVAAAAFAIQSVEEAKTTKLKSSSRKENGRNGMLHSSGITSQFSYKKTKYAVENSKDKPMKQKTKELERVYSAAKPSSKYAAIPIAPGDNAEWIDKLKSIVACGSDKMLKNLRLNKKYRKNTLELRRASYAHITKKTRQEFRFIRLLEGQENLK